MGKSNFGVIELYDGMVIVVDAYNYSLAKIRTKKDKNGNDIEYFDYIAHYSTLDRALMEFRHYLIREELFDGVRSLTEAIQTITDIEAKAEKFIKENIPER